MHHKLMTATGWLPLSLLQPPAQSSYIGLSCFCSNMQNGLLPFNIHSSLPDFIFHCRLLSEPHWLCHFAPRRSMVVPIIFRDNLDRKKLDHIGVSFSCRRMERCLPDFITCIGSRSSSRVTILNFPGLVLAATYRIVCFALSLVHVCSVLQFHDISLVVHVHGQM
jgi:hypothetical protein